MTNPPPPGNWGPPQPGPQPPYAQGQPPYGPPGQWPAQQGWGPPPQPPRNNDLKWLLIGVAVLLVIAITVGATLLFTRDGGDGPPTATGAPPAAGGIASANDTGPVGIITEDPTCAAWRPIATTIARQQKQGWTDRNPSIPATAWSAEQRQIYEAAADAMRTAADQTVALAKKTPHRVMRELYEQSIAYWRAYADSIDTYTEADNLLAQVSVNTASAVVSICGTIEREAAQARGPLIPEGPPPLPSASTADPSNPPRFLLPPEPSACSEWASASDAFDTETTEWREGDLTADVNSWTPDRKKTMEDAAITIDDHADRIIQIGNSSENTTFADFAALSAQYWRAYTAAFPSYTANDGYLAEVASYANFIIFNACASVSN